MVQECVRGWKSHGDREGEKPEEEGLQLTIHDSMNGLEGNNGVAPFPDFSVSAFLCLSNNRIIFLLEMFWSTCLSR